VIVEDPDGTPTGSAYESMRSFRPSLDQTPLAKSGAPGSWIWSSTPSAPSAKMPSKMPSGPPDSRSKTIRPIGSRPTVVADADALGVAAPLDGATAVAPGDPGT
jgi:hypothetical protein